MLTGAFLYLPLVFMPEADSLKHPQQFYLTLPLQQTVFARYGNSHRRCLAYNFFRFVSCPYMPLARHPEKESTF